MSCYGGNCFEAVEKAVSVMHGGKKITGAAALCKIANANVKLGKGDYPAVASLMGSALSDINGGDCGCSGAGEDDLSKLERNIRKPVKKELGECIKITEEASQTLQYSSIALDYLKAALSAVGQFLESHVDAENAHLIREYFDKLKDIANSSQEIQNEFLAIFGQESKISIKDLVDSLAKDGKITDSTSRILTEFFEKSDKDFEMPVSITNIVKSFVMLPPLMVEAHKHLKLLSDKNAEYKKYESNFYEKCADILEKMEEDIANGKLKDLPDEDLVKAVEFFKSKCGRVKKGGAVIDEDEKLKDLENKLEAKKEVKKIEKKVFSKILQSGKVKLIHSVVELKNAVVKADLQTGYRLRAVISQLRGLMREFLLNKNIEYSLSGYYDDLESRGIKDSFENKLRLTMSYVKSAADDPINSNVKSSLMGVHDGLQDMLGEIERWTKVVTADRIPRTLESVMTGSDDSCVSPSANIEGIYQMGGADSVSVNIDDEIFNCHANTTESIGEEAATGGALSGTVQELNAAIDDLNYFYNLYEIKDNLQHTAKDLDEYGATYDKVLGQAIAKKIMEINAYYNNLEEEVSPSEDEVSSEENIKQKKLLRKERDLKLKYIAKEHEARVGLYKVAESVDLYLKMFTKGLTANAENIQDIKVMLDNTEVVSEWWNSKTIEYLEKALGMDTTPARDVTNKLVVCDIEGDKVVEEFKKVRENLSDHLDNFEALHNICSIFAYIGEKFAGKSFVDTTIMKAGQMYKGLKSYMKWCSFILGLNTEDDLTEQLNLISDNRGPEYEKLMTNIRVLISEYAFAMTSKNYDTRDKDDIAYITNFINDVLEKVRDALSKDLRAEKFVKAIKNRKIHHNILDDVKTFANVSNEDVLTYLMNAIQEGLEKVYNVDTIVNDNNMFVMIIKAMMAKVYTVLDTYRMIKIRDVEQNDIPLSIDPLRILIGGGDMSNPSVYESNVETYLRLVLLAQYYKRLFEFGGPGNEDSAVAFTMIPDKSGIFGGLIKAIWIPQHGLDVETDMDYARLIAEINKIAENYKSAKNPVREAVHGFVSEINRRYGLYSKDYYDRYNEEYFKEKRYNAPGDLYDQKKNDLNKFKLLDGEDDDSSVAGPSDKYVKSTIGSFGIEKEHEKLKYQINMEQKKLLDRFRAHLEESFERSNKPSGIRDFRQITQRIVHDLKRQTTAEERFRTVKKVFTTFADVPAGKIEIFVAFHEFVILGLNTLSVTTDYLKSFNDLLINAVEDNMTNNRTGAVRNDAINGVFEKLYSFTCGCKDDLVSLEYVDDKFVMNFDKLQTVMTKTLASIKRFMDKMRYQLGDEFVDSYMSVAGYGYYYYEKLLIDWFKQTENANYIYGWSDKLNRKITEGLNKSTNPLASIRFALFGVHKPRTNQLISITKIDKSFINLLSHFDSVEGKSKVFYPSTLYKNNDLYVWDDALDVIHGNITINNSGFSQEDAANNTISSQSSILVVFNRIVASMLNVFYDNGKYYYPLFEKFISCPAFTNNISAQNGFKDIFGDKGDTSDNGREIKFNEVPSSGAPSVSAINYNDDDFGSDKMLFRSLAMILYNISKERSNKTGDLYYVVKSLSEVSVDMKDKYRVLLPSYVRLMQLLRSRCLLYRQFVRRSYKEGKVDEANSIMMTDCVDKVTEGLQCLIDCCRDVLKDMGSEKDLYFDIEKDFIKRYQEANGRKPFMPLSTSFLVQFNQMQLDPNNLLLLPGKNVNKPESYPYKYLCGMKPFVKDEEINYSDFTGLHDIVETYNITNDSSKIMEDEAAEYLKLYSTLLRYNMNNYLYKFYLSQYGNMALRPMSLVVSPTVNINNVIWYLPPHDNVSLTLIIQKTKSPYINESLWDIAQKAAEDANVRLLNAGTDPTKDAKLAQMLETSTSNRTRENMQIENIIDLNIVPINIHAMMREIALANIFNYAYSFDSYMFEVLDIKDRNKRFMMYDMGRKYKSNVPSSYDPATTTGMAGADYMYAFLVKPLATKTFYNVDYDATIINYLFSADEKYCHNLITRVSAKNASLYNTFLVRSELFISLVQALTIGHIRDIVVTDRNLTLKSYPILKENY